MELEIGMYYRYKGIIGKYYKPDLGKPFFTNQHKYTYNEIANYGKFSHNIIDLIEVGDYVNGMEVTYIGGTRYDKNDLHCYCDNNINKNLKEVMIPAKDIKSIATKEQFSQISYNLPKDK